jgi:hypothetical protein
MLRCFDTVVFGLLAETDAVLGVESADSCL